MIVSRNDAAAALDAAHRAQARSAELFSYVRFAPYLFVTGFLWLFADLSLRFVPALRPWAWPIAWLAAPTCYVLIGLRDRRDTPGRTVFLGWTMALAFAVAAFAILQPSGHQLHALTGLATGATFAAAGLRHGARLLYLGMAIAALSLGVHFTLEAGDNIIAMGLVGGGGMMLGAGWLRQA